MWRSIKVRCVIANNTIKTHPLDFLLLLYYYIMLHLAWILFKLTRSKRFSTYASDILLNIAHICYYTPNNIVCKKFLQGVGG